MPDFRLIPTIPDTGPDLNTVGALIDNISNWLLFLAVAAAIIMIIIGAYYYIFSFGDANKATKGKTIVLWAVVGMAVVIMARVIVNVVTGFVGKAPAAPSPGLFNQPPVK